MFGLQVSGVDDLKMFLEDRRHREIFFVLLDNVPGECGIVASMDQYDMPLFLFYRETGCTEEERKSARLMLVASGYRVGGGDGQVFAFLERGVVV